MLRKCGMWKEMFRRLDKFERPIFGGGWGGACIRDVNLVTYFLTGGSVYTGEAY